MIPWLLLGHLESQPRVQDRINIGAHTPGYFHWWINALSKVGPHGNHPFSPGLGSQLLSPLCLDPEIPRLLLRFSRWPGQPCPLGLSLGPVSRNVQASTCFLHCFIACHLQNVRRKEKGWDDDSRVWQQAPPTLCTGPCVTPHNIQALNSTHPHPTQEQKEDEELCLKRKHWNHHAQKSYFAELTPMKTFAFAWVAELLPMETDASCFLQV